VITLFAYLLDLFIALQTIARNHSSQDQVFYQVFLVCLCDGSLLTKFMEINSGRGVTTERTTEREYGATGARNINTGDYMSEEERRALGVEGARRGVEGIDINDREGHRERGGVREKLHELKEVCAQS
jgi:hypothetical protein